MKITAITQDQLIIVDGVGVDMRPHGGFEMRRGEWAVQFDTVTGRGEVEYTDARHNSALTQADFDKHYAWLMDEHQRAIEKEKADEAATPVDSGGTGGGVDAL
ncbi:hypothetical protein [Grimontia sp. NTOU-MAR1]|uniref:hypothetical protein n=1 Tax=Grimontia sp. NTOU-MAR1 TaxID=3111011 RepID=UPI002DBF23A4|nr:hypothetical protein [Grimontia sp. NTOU-MAR1]WRV98258.1 hypothetical protein VP504_02135 [Grimontia sp. NTOU-MAR1]